MRAKLVTIGPAGVIVDLWGKEEGVLDLREIAVSGAPEPRPGAPRRRRRSCKDRSRGGNVVVTRDSHRAEHGREYYGAGVQFQ